MQRRTIIESESAKKEKKMCENEFEYEAILLSHKRSILFSKYSYRLKMQRYFLQFIFIQSLAT
jgi:hypothetical protein